MLHFGLLLTLQNLRECQGMKHNQVERGQKLGNTQETKHFWAILNNAAVPTHSFIDVHVKQFQYE